VFPVRHELGSYIPEYGILHSHCLQNLKSYIEIVGSAFTSKCVGTGLSSYKNEFTGPRYHNVGSLQQAAGCTPYPYRREGEDKP
jgi:hypothetical protein